MFFRTATARGKAEQADYAAVCANEDSTEVDNNDGDRDDNDDGIVDDNDGGIDDGNGDKDDDGDDDGDGMYWWNDDGDDNDDVNGDKNDDCELSRLVPALVTLLPSSSNQVRIKSK